MRIPITKDIEASALASQLATALGIPVAVSSRNPGQDDGKGGTLPGVVVLIDPATGVELPDQDATKVAAVIAAHVVAPPQPTPHRALATAVASASNVNDLKAALAAFAGGVADAEDKAKDAQAKARTHKKPKASG
jgi:hypothetical protein